MATVTAPPTAQGEGTFVPYERPPQSASVPPSTPPARVSRVGRFEALVVFLLFTGAYAALGYQVMIVQHVVVFDALDRLARAYLVWHDAPPKLAVIGFDLPPVGTLALLPVTLVKPVASSLIGLVFSSAVFAGGVIVLLDRLLARCEMPRLMRYPALLLFGANPLFAFYASNGMPEMTYLFFLTATLYALLSWVMTGSTRFLVLAGTALSICVLTRYEFIIWALPLTLMVGATLTRWRASRGEIEGTAIVFAVPACYALGLWSLFNGLIVKKPFGWIGDGVGSLAVNSDQIAHSGGATVHMVATRLGEILTGTAPLAIAVLPLLMLLFFSRREETSLWLAGLVALAVVIVGADALLAGKVSVLTLSDGLTIGLVAFIGAAWIYRASNGAGTLVWLIALALLAATLPLAWQRMQTYPFQNQEQAFVRALNSGEDQEGTSSIGGYHVGIAPELRMADFIDRNIASEHAILTDNAQSYAVILLSGRPGLFFDRVQRGDAIWRTVSENPYGRVAYLLIATQAKQDILRARYPVAANGADPDFRVLFRTSRYILLRVPPRPPSLTSTPSLTLPGLTGQPALTAPAATSAIPGTSGP
ncbi:MAG TPA: hypothetical protein VMV16_05095 [Solirubrobacteraceae bacterium]|nr:hypothetical protein [Solirubrobacteraceae bacterium]